eukprot:GHVN01064763.1.p2 GENE.GHVN01064763.1~~GHVN01064763.1.p2  ORF type:complete len:153 (+),score=49.42 GHVN01064763.1:417-875(+)
MKWVKDLEAVDNNIEIVSSHFKLSREVNSLRSQEQELDRAIHQINIQTMQLEWRKIQDDLASHETQLELHRRDRIDLTQLRQNFIEEAEGLDSEITLCSDTVRQVNESIKSSEVALGESEIELEGVRLSLLYTNEGLTHSDRFKLRSEFNIT